MNSSSVNSDNFVLALLLKWLSYAFFGIALAITKVQATETVHLQLRWHHQFQFAGYYAAIEKGYYQNAGLEVILHEASPGKTPTQQVLQGHAQYGEANSELLLARLRGEPLVALAAIYQHSPSILLARKDSGILSPEDLIGKKTMMVNQLEDADFIAMFHNEGLDIANIQLIPSSYNIQDMVDGKVVAFNAYTSNEPYVLKQQGVEYTVLNPRNYGVDFYSDVLFTSEQEIKDHPERVKAFREASLQGWRYAMDHPQEIIDLLLNKYQVSKVRDHLEFEAEAMKSLIMPDLIEIGHMNPWRWQHMAQTFVNTGMVANDQLLQGFIYNSDPVSDRKKLIKYAWTAAIIAIIPSVLALFIYVAYRSLKRENTLRKQTEHKLQSSENRFKTMFNQAPLGIALIDSLTGCIYTANPMFAKIIGKSLEDLSTVNWLSISSSDNMKNYFKNMAQLNTGKINWFKMQQYYLHDGGQVVWTNMTIAPIQHKDKQQRHHLCMLEDITERKQIDEALRESESRFRDLFEKAPSAYHSLDIDANILDINETWLLLLGYTRAEVIGHFIGDFMADNSVIKLHQDFNYFKDKGHIDGMLCEFVSKAGIHRTLSINGQVSRDSTGKFLRTHNILTDITELMEAKNTAETANKAKNLFLANLSHELRTPLSGILGFTSLLQKKTSFAIEDQQHLGIIKQCGDNLLTLITDLLDIATIESNKIKSTSSVFDFGVLLNNIGEIFKLQADQKQLALIIHLTAMPDYLEGDEKHLWQILINLLNNAIKYTEQGRVTVSSGYQNGKLTISIEDTGCGIAQENLEQIFSPFVQLNTGDFIMEGLGLGLAITQRLIKHMGGELSVTSQVGIGSVFSVSVPLLACEKKLQAISHQPAFIKKQHGLNRILIADDNEINLLLLANLLELQGYRVDSAMNGKIALQLINENQYQMALIDLNMPVMTGLELVTILRSAGNPLKIAAISAYADDNKVSAALAAGFDYYLTKPIEEDKLIALLNLQ